ncbi:MAG TPA: hypothetical protein VK524_21750, partial [Polyangiaceae bacterium]|nr:hypothetical protein [Polyangiaceae bacterium]
MRDQSSSLDAGAKQGERTRQQDPVSFQQPDVLRSSPGFREVILHAQDSVVDANDAATLHVAEDAGTGDLQRIGYVGRRKSWQGAECEARLCYSGVLSTESFVSASS